MDVYSPFSERSLAKRFILGSCMCCEQKKNLSFAPLNLLRAQGIRFCKVPVVTGNTTITDTNNLLLLVKISVTRDISHLGQYYSSVHEGQFCSLNTYIFFSCLGCGINMWSSPGYGIPWGGLWVFNTWHLQLNVREIKTDHLIIGKVKSFSRG